MVRFELGVEDLARTRFGISPLAETVRSLRALSDPSRHTLYLPWLRSIRRDLDGLDLDLLLALVGPPRGGERFVSAASQALPDFLTPVPDRFIARFDEELERASATTTETARRHLLATHAPDPVPGPLVAVMGPAERPVRSLVGSICDALERYHELALAPTWPDMRLVLEADTTYRARQLAVGGARQLFADMHPNLRWHDGALDIDEMISEHTVAANGRGLLLMPSIFAVKPVPPMLADEAPSLAYPSRGIGTLWAPPPPRPAAALASLIGAPRAQLLDMLAEPLPTIEIARRLRVTPSAVSQHLKVLYTGGLVTRARDGRQVLYRRTGLGDQLAG
ncbi:MAG: winged helix-turn-helix transcriptional regulator [Solirubrobacterales bacterium]|nr:winged helix-turn-helix transcriptional regulator [Solirubrobacterales bacterium]